MNKVKINLSTTTVIRTGIIEFKGKTNKEYDCADMYTCSGVDCNECIFDKGKLEFNKIKKLIIRR